MFLSGQCLRDTFNVRPSIGVKVPTICGYNSGHHSKWNTNYLTLSDQKGGPFCYTLQIFIVILLCKSIKVIGRAYVFEGASTNGP